MIMSIVVFVYEGKVRTACESLLLLTALCFRLSSLRIAG